MKGLARDIYDQYFVIAQATPRGVVAKLCAIVAQLENACDKHSSQVKVVRSFSLLCSSALCARRELGIVNEHLYETH